MCLLVEKPNASDAIVDPHLRDFHYTPHMRSRFLQALALFLLFASAAAAQTPELRSLDAYIARAVRDWQVPGVAVVIVKDDKVVLAKGYGVRDVRSKEPVDERTIFGIASNTKAFAAAALAILVDEKKIAWDDRVTKYLPDFEMSDPYVTRELRVRDLLSHRSGLAPYGGDIMTWGSSYSREEVVARIRHVKPASSFRSRYAYQNGMFIVAGEIVEKVTGKSWDDFVRERFFQPLRMTSTTTRFADLANERNVATPHIHVDGRVEPIPWRNVENLGAAAAINSNAADLAQWLRLQLGEGKFDGKAIFSREASHEMWMPQTSLPLALPEKQTKPIAKWSAYGLGWSIRDYHGYRLIRHGGWTDGMLSMVALIPERNIGVAILTNLHNRNITAALAYRIFDTFLGTPQEDWSAYYLGRVKDAEAREAAAVEARAKQRTKNTRPSLPIREYAGTYSNEVYGDVRIAVDGDRLVASFLASPTYVAVLEHWHYDTFMTRWNERIPEPGLLWFTIGPNANVRDFTTSLGEFVEPANYTFTRVE